MKVRNIVSAGLITLANVIRAKAEREMEEIPETRILGWLLAKDNMLVFDDPEAVIEEREVIGGKEGMPRYGLKMKVVFGNKTWVKLKLCGVTFYDRQEKIRDLSDKEIRFARVPNPHSEYAIAVVLV